MPEERHDPKSSTAYVIRYLKSNPGKNKIIKEVKGQKEAVKLLKELSEGEAEPKKYDYLWRWKDPQAALAYDLEHFKP